MAFPGIYNFNYYRGDKLTFTVYPKTSNGSAFPISPTYTVAEFKIANRRGSAGTQTTAQAQISGNTVICTITPTVGRTLEPGTYVYDVQLRDSGSAEVITVVTGSITITDDITGAVA